MSSSANSSQPQDREHNASSSPVLTAKLAETLASTTLSQHMSSHKADAKSEDEIHDKEEVISPHTDVLSKIKDGPEVNSFDSSDPSSHVAKGASAASNRTESYPRAESKASDAKCSLDFEAEMKAIPAEGTPEFYECVIDLSMKLYPEQSVLSLTHTQLARATLCFQPRSGSPCRMDENPHQRQQNVDWSRSNTRRYQSSRLRCRHGLSQPCTSEHNIYTVIVSSTSTDDRSDAVGIVSLRHSNPRHRFLPQDGSRIQRAS